MKKRDLLKAIPAVVIVPKEWVKPVVESVLLPAHATTSEDMPKKPCQKIITEIETLEREIVELEEEYLICVDSDSVVSLVISDAHAVVECDPILVEITTRQERIGVLKQELIECQEPEE